MMTRRLLEEKVFEEVVKKRLVEKARIQSIGANSSAMSNEEEMQLEQVLSKLNLEEIIR